MSAERGDDALGSGYRPVAHLVGGHRALIVRARVPGPALTAPSGPVSSSVMTMTVRLQSEALACQPQMCSVAPADDYLIPAGLAGRSVVLTSAAKRRHVAEEIHSDPAARSFVSRTRTVSPDAPTSTQLPSPAE